MGYTNCASVVERWTSNCWEEDPSVTPLDTCRTVCATSKLQWQQGLTTAFNRYKMIWERHARWTRTGNLFRKGPRSRWENLWRSTSSHLHSTYRRVWSRLRTHWDEIWEETKEEVTERVRGRVNRSVREDSPMADETEVQKSFWLRRPDGWVINRKMKKIILLEFKRTIDVGESYFQDMWKVAEK